MKSMRKALSALGGIFLAALLIAALAPKATRAIAAALVQVVNTASNPVVTTDSLGTATLFQVTCSLQGAGAPSSDACFTVPAGKRAIVENVDGFCSTQVGNAVNRFYLAVGTPDFLQNVFHRIPLSFEGQDAFGFNYYDFNFVVRIYADPGQIFTTSFISTTGATCQVNISGRLAPTS